MNTNLGGDGSLGYETAFEFNDGTVHNLRVVGSKYYKYEAMTIQISKVIDPTDYKVTKDGVLYPYSYVYEEIDNDDFVTYCRFMGEDNIKRAYPWARDLLK